MTWQILVTISVVTYSVSVLLQRIVLKNNKTDSIAFSILFQLLTGFLILIYAIFRGFSVPDLQVLAPNLVLMVFLYSLGNILVFKALKEEQASAFTILFATRSLWTIFAAVLFLGESFSSKQFLGALLILLSVVLVSWQKKFRFSRGTVLSLLAALVFGVEFANDAYIMQTFDAFSYVSLAFILPGLVSWAVFPTSSEKMKVMLNKSFLQKTILLSLVYAVSAATIFLAYQVGRNAAQISVLNQTSVILTVFLAIIFLKEKSRLPIKILGAVFSFVGILLVG